jgi:hypothetical protein
MRTTSDFDLHKPKTVLVLPPENMTSNTDVLQKSYPFIFSEMAQRGYYVVSPELALQLFRANKLNDPGQINNLPTTKFNEVYGVDAVLKTKVTDWSSKYVVVSASVSVGFDMTLVDARSGTVLWSDSRVLSQTPNNGNNNSILGALVNAALTAATTPYEPIASDNARFMLSTIPQGPYHAQK